MYELSQKFMFEAAHTLKRSIDTESSGRVHGHTYFGEVTVSGCPDTGTGMVIDLDALRKQIERVRKDLDHRLLDDVSGLGAPTLENLCRFVYDRMRHSSMNITAVRVWREGSGDACRLSFSPEGHNV